MYLTRFEINSARRGSRKLLSSQQAMHAAVLSAFAREESQPTDAGRVLWRLDYAGPQVMLYVASPAEPDLTHLVEQAGWPTTQTWQTRDYLPLLASLSTGQHWAFRLTANPARSGRKAEGGQTQRFGHVTVEQQQDWLLARASRCGFDVAHNSINGLELSVHQRLQKSFEKREGRVTISTATFDGCLTVRDPSALAYAMTHGIGSAKAYGCGLLTLAPVALDG